MRKTEQAIQKPSDGMRALMKEHAAYLSRQTGSHGLCCVCGRDIPKTEFCGKPQYADGRVVTEKVCVDCIDAHSAGPQ